jgi:hypothetical protein
MSERLLQVQVESIEDMVPTNIVGTKFIAGETGLHIRQVQRLAKREPSPKPAVSIIIPMAGYTVM